MKHFLTVILLFIAVVFSYSQVFDSNFYILNGEEENYTATSFYVNENNVTVIEWGESISYSYFYSDTFPDDSGKYNIYQFTSHTDEGFKYHFFYEEVLSNEVGGVLESTFSRDNKISKLYLWNERE